MRRLLRENGLSIVLLGFFLALMVAQSIAGHREYNEDQRDHGSRPIGYSEYLTTGHYLESVFENWESEFFQMGFYVILTVFLRQKGSSESKKLTGREKVDEDPRKSRNEPKAPGPVRRGGWVLKLYEHSLSLAFLLLFLLSFFLHGLYGLRAYNEELADHGRPEATLGEYMGGSQFWFESFQNWQSEFLAVASIVLLSIFLRERGSPESKPVAAPHSETGTG